MKPVTVRPVASVTAISNQLPVFLMTSKKVPSAARLMTADVASGYWRILADWTLTLMMAASAKLAMAKNMTINMRANMVFFMGPPSRSILWDLKSAVKGEKGNTNSRPISL